jgi:ATP-binding cassette subfamily B protein
MKSRETVTNLAWAARFVWQSGPVLTMASALLVVVQGVLPLIGIYLIKLVIDSVAAGLSEPDKAIAFKGIASLIVFSALVVLLENVCSSLAGFMSAVQSHIVTDRMYDILHSKSVEMDLEYYENSQYYDSLHRAQQEAPYRPTRIVQGLLHLGQSGIALIAIIGLLVSFHWIVPLLLLLAATPGLLVRFKFAEKAFFWQRQRTETERQAGYLNWILTRDTHAKELRLFDLGQLFIDRFQQLRTRLREERIDLMRKRSLSELITQSGANVTAFGLYAFLAYRTIYGLITLGDLVMFYQAVQRGQSYLSQFLGSIAQLYENNLFLSNVHEFFALKPKVVEHPRPKSIASPFRQGIIFHGVSFHYPGSNRKVLDQIDLRIRPGEHIALVGENGAGKTTLIKLLARLYDPNEGKITLDGIDLKEISLRELRRQISVVFQDYARYQLTVKENIRLGDIDVPANDQRIVKAAHDAGAEKVIAGLKNGYDTLLGSWFENGAELSIGEWQKIALARAFLRESAIIVLDEPTSAMDARAEYELFNKFHQLAKGRTAILISHRLSTVRMVDRILVLEDGKIVEGGTHDELLHHGGKYADLFETQARYYR